MPFAGCKWPLPCVFRALWFLQMHFFVSFVAKSVARTAFCCTFVSKEGLFIDFLKVETPF